MKHPWANATMLGAPKIVPFCSPLRTVRAADADNVRPSSQPDQWQIGKLVLACSVLGICLLGFCTGSLLLGKYQLGLDISALQTLAAITLVFGGEATLYAIRERQHLWNSRSGTRQRPAAQPRHSACPDAVVQNL